MFNLPALTLDGLDTALFDADGARVLSALSTTLLCVAKAPYLDPEYNDFDVILPSFSPLASAMMRPSCRSMRSTLRRLILRADRCAGAVTNMGGAVTKWGLQGRGARGQV